MIATWMLYGTVVALLAGLGALALERGAQLLGRAGRWCWVGAMVVTLALPVAAWFRPHVLQPLPIVIPTDNGVVEAAPPVTITAPALTFRPGHHFSWGDLNWPLAAAWGLLSLGLLAWFAVGSWRLAGMRKSWRSDGGLWVSKDVGPAVVGFLRCQVVVPEWSLALSQDQRDLLLAHEAEHLAAYDSRLLLAAAVVLALVPWNPGLWWQVRKLRLAIELDCDQRVLRRRPDPATYGRLLLEVGARVTRTLLPVTAFYEPMSSLEKRIRSMTAKRPRGARILAAGMLLGAVAAIFFACEAPRPTAPAGGRAPSIETQEPRYVVSAKLVADSVRRYFRDGVPRRPVFVWFVLNADHRVVRWGASPRNPDDHTIRSQAVDSVIPEFPAEQMYSLTIFGENNLGPASPPVYWAVLRDPARPVAHLPTEVDSLALLPWVRDGLLKWWSPLLKVNSGDSVEVWFVADMRHRILVTYASRPSIKAGPDVGTLVRRKYPGIRDDMLYGFTTGGAHSWGPRNLQIVWVTLRDGPATEEWFQGLRQESLQAQPDTTRSGPWLRSAKGDGEAASMPTRGAMLEKGYVLVASRYPQYLHTLATPPDTIWVMEGRSGRLSVQASKASDNRPASPTIVAGVSQQMRVYTGSHPGDWVSSLPLSETRTDVVIVWMHSDQWE